MHGFPPASFTAGVNHNNLVAELPFGFWVGLFDKPYELRWETSFESSKAETNLQIIFPNNPSATRKLIHNKLSKGKTLRDPMAHYHPVFHLQLKDIYENDLCALLGWICKRTLMVMEYQCSTQFRRILLERQKGCELKGQVQSDE